MNTRREWKEGRYPLTLSEDKRTREREREAGEEEWMVVGWMKRGGNLDPSGNPRRKKEARDLRPRVCGAQRKKAGKTGEKGEISAKDETEQTWKG